MKRLTIAAVLAALLLCLPVPAAAAAEAAVPENGTYTVEVSLSGGSGRSSISSPAELKVEQSKLSATIIWSSSSYEYMLVDGVQYDPLPGEEYATFELPVVLDEEMNVSALTVAMSEPHLIEYRLYFDSSTLRSAAAESAGFPLWLAVVAVLVIVALAVLFFYQGRMRGISEGTRKGAGKSADKGVQS